MKTRDPTDQNNNGVMNEDDGDTFEGLGQRAARTCGVLGGRRANVAARNDADPYEDDGDTFEGLGQRAARTCGVLGGRRANVAARNDADPYEDTAGVTRSLVKHITDVVNRVIQQFGAAVVATAR